jgi:PAS domain S-box-containing protein
MASVPRKSPDSEGDSRAGGSQPPPPAFPANTEETFRLLVENTKDYAIFMLDVDGRIMTWNVGAQRIKGYQADEIIGKHFSVFYPPEAVASGWPQQELEYATRDGRFEDEGWRVRKDGTRFMANVVITAIRDDTGTLRGFGKVTRDVTERKLHEDQVQQLTVELAHRAADLTAANRDLLEKSAENERFVYGVSHDLRSPLVNLQGFSRELISATDELRHQLDEPLSGDDLRTRMLGVIDRDMAESIRYIRSAVAHLSSIVEGLLRLSRIGRVEYRWQRVDVTELTTEIVTAMHAVIDEKQAEVHLQALPRAWADRDALSQVFANLIGNALQHLDPARRGHIEIGADQSNGATVYFVRDNGVGISERQRAKLFQPFYKAQTTTRGEGMGLAIVQRIVDRHGGKVWLDSTPGAGTTFYFTLASAPPASLGPGPTGSPHP